MIAAALLFVSFSAYAQDIKDGSEQLWISGTTNTAMFNSGCSFAQINAVPPFQVTIDWDCTNKFAANYQPMADETTQFAFILKAIHDHTAIEK